MEENVFSLSQCHQETSRAAEPLSVFFFSFFLFSIAQFSCEIFMLPFLQTGIFFLFFSFFYLKCISAVLVFQWRRVNGA